MADQQQYSDKVMEHFRNPRNVGEIKNPDGTGHVGNPVCIIPETLVYANPDAKEIKEISKDTNVLTHDGMFHRVKKVYRRNYRGKVYSISVHNLGKTITTPEHHILALKTSNSAYKFRDYKKYIPDWYSAEELEKGDTILYPISKEVVDRKSIDFNVDRRKWDFKSKTLPEKIAVSNEFLRLVGYYLAEGYVRTDRSKGTVGFVFGSGEMGYAGDVICIMDEVFELKPNDIEQRRNSLHVLYYSARLARFFEESLGKRAENKFIPPWALLLPPERQESLICGLWRGDGCVNSKGAKYVTISKRLAYQLRFLLHRQKIIFSFLTIPEKGIHKENYCIYVKEENSLRRLGSMIGAKVYRNPKKRNPCKSWFDNDYYYATIKNVRKADFNGTVYNLEVDKAHSYISDSLCLHNCGDIMELYIKVQNGIIVDAKFKTFGCGAAIATSSMVTELVKGKTVEEALKVSNRAVAEALGGLPKIKMHCSVLAEEALKGAINDYLKKSGKSEDKK